VPPCLVCKKHGLPQPCQHYDNEHVIGCAHQCSGLGRQGTHPDEDLVMQDALEEGFGSEEVFDDSEINLRRVNLVPDGSTITKPKQFRRKRTAWALTNGGIPFLRSTSPDVPTYFLWRDGDSWTVGSKPRNGRAQRLYETSAFAEAVKHAESLHPRGGRPPSPLVGPATEGQLRTLRNVGVSFDPEISKDEASQLLDVALTSISLDR
jgi:hypothetical protein